MAVNLLIHTQCESVYSRILPYIAAEVDKVYSEKHDFPVVLSEGDHNVVINAA